MNLVIRYLSFKRIEMKFNFINENKNVSECFRKSYVKLFKIDIVDVLILILVFNEY